MIATSLGTRIRHERVTKRQRPASFMFRRRRIPGRIGRPNKLLTLTEAMDGWWMRCRVRNAPPYSDHCPQPGVNRPVGQGSVTFQKLVEADTPWHLFSIWARTPAAEVACASTSANRDRMLRALITRAEGDPDAT